MPGHLSFIKTFGVPLIFLKFDFYILFSTFKLNALPIHKISINCFFRDGDDHVTAVPLNLKKS